LHEIKFAFELIGVVPCAAVRATLQWYFQPATFLRGSYIFAIERRGELAPADWKAQMCFDSGGNLG
jgi:hypothetical protein